MGQEGLEVRRRIMSTRCGYLRGAGKCSNLGSRKEATGDSWRWDDNCRCSQYPTHRPANRWPLVTRLLLHPSKVRGDKWIGLGQIFVLAEWTSGFWKSFCSPVRSNRASTEDIENSIRPPVQYFSSPAIFVRTLPVQYTYIYMETDTLCTITCSFLNVVL